MDDRERAHAVLGAAVTGAGGGRVAAEQLCRACVDLFDIDGAAVSVIYDGWVSRSLGASSLLSRELDELQFTFGEGPCLQCVNESAPVLVDDLNDPAARRWPSFAHAAAVRGVRAVFALPIAVAGVPMGALDLYRNRPGGLDVEAMAGGLLAAELAAVPLLNLLGLDVDAAVSDHSGDPWDELTSLTRVEVYQAVGMLIAQLGVTSSEALVRLRGYAFVHDMTASAVAFEILERKLRLTNDRTGPPWGETGGDGG